MKVTKMHGCGNDFCIIKYKEYEDYTALATELCDRKIGVGADGLIIVKEKPLEMIFYNADGSRAPMCGNGIRCFSRYALENGLIKKDKFDVLTLAGKMVIEITSKDPFMCKVDLGSPIFNNQSIYVSDNIDCFGRIVNIGGVNVTTYSFFMGTIHTVVFVDSFDDYVVSLASELSNHPMFNRKTNVNFVKVINPTNIYVKTYERGVGFTYACGTGCCASVVTAHKLGLVENKVRVDLELGHLDIELIKKNVFMTGPAVKTFECEFKEEENA